MNVTFSIPTGYTAPDPISNTASVSSSTDDPDPSNNTDTERLRSAPTPPIWR